MKITVTAIITFNCDTSDADPDSVPIDQAHELTVSALPSGFDLEEILEWKPA